MHRQLSLSGHGHDNRLQRATSRPVTAIQRTADRPSVPDHVSASRRQFRGLFVRSPSSPTLAFPPSIALARHRQTSSSETASLCQPSRSSNSPGPRAGHEAVCRRSIPAPWPQLLVRFPVSYLCLHLCCLSAIIPARVASDLLLAASATLVICESPPPEGSPAKADGALESSATPGPRSSTPIRTSSHGM